MSKHKHHIIPRYRCKELGIDPDFDENIVEVDRLDHARIHWGYKCDDLEPLFEYITPAQWIIDLIPRGDNRDVGAAVINAKGELDGIDMSGENHPMWGKKHTPETIEKLRANSARAFLGKTHTPEIRERIKESQSGDTNSSYKHGMYINHKNDINVRRASWKWRNENDPSIAIKARKRSKEYKEKNRDEINRKAREHRILNKEEVNRKRREYLAKGDNADKIGRRQKEKRQTPEGIAKVKDYNAKALAKKKAETQGEGNLDPFLR